MLSKSQIKLITRLGQKKYRNQDQLFVVEGVKSIKEFLNSVFELHSLFTIDTSVFNSDKCTIISGAELQKISFLKTPNTALAIFKIPQPKTIDTSQLIVALDNVSDPGNLGTIIRLCDWFGVRDLVCNLETVDCFNPKVIQATMGSITRVNVSYIDLKHFLNDTKSEVFGAFMDGENVYNATLPIKGVLVLGNEANGIGKTIEGLVTKKIAIPQFGNSITESLNVATATSILLSEFKRRTT